MAWQSQRLSLIFPKQLEFQISFTCSLVSAPLRIPVGSSVTLCLICWSFMYSLCCNCCSLVALAFHVPFMFFGRRESEAKVEAPAVSGKQKNTQGRCGTPSLTGPRSDQYRRFDVVFESPASPTVLYQLSLTGNMSGPYLRGEGSSGKEKTEEHLQRFAGKKKQAVKTLSLNDGSWTGKGKKMLSCS